MYNRQNEDGTNEHLFLRSELLIGQAGLEKLANSSVYIFGLGGVGSYTAEALCRVGIGNFKLIDFDEISLTNINRQLHALHSTIGRSKVEVMRERMRDINPDVEITIHKAFYDAEDGEIFLSDKPDYVVDAIDTVKSKVSLVKECHQRGIPLISCMGAGNRLDASTFKIDDISKTTGCPLAKAVRRLLKQEGISRGFKVVYSPEPALKPLASKPFEQEDTQITNDINTKDDHDIRYSNKRQTPGSVSFVPSVAGLLMAGEVVRDILHRS